jgi:membrane-associated phospholipid phosphatase
MAPSPMRRACLLAGHPWRLARGIFSRPAVRFRDHRAIVVLLAAGAVVTALLAAQFIELAELVATKNAALQNFDRRWHERALSVRSPGATTFFVAMSLVGGPMVLGIVGGAVSAALLVARRLRPAVYILVNGGGTSLVHWELKRHFARVRPATADMLRFAQGYSFPSGHAMASTAVVGALTYLALRVLEPRWLKAAAIALWSTFVIAVSVSRVYLGAHWLSDVAAGITVGLLWLTTTTTTYEAFRRLRSMGALRSARPDDVPSPGP